MNGNGNRLKMARRVRGLSQQALAEQVGISRTMISKYERAQARPGPETLTKLTNALGVREDLLRQPPPELTIKPLYQKHRRMNSTEEITLIARVQAWLERYLVVEAFFSPKERVTFKFPPGFPYPVTYMDDAETAAVKLREAWQMGTNPVDNLTELLEDQGIKVGLVGGDERFDTYTLWADTTMPVIAILRELSGEFLRLNLAQELGYLVLDMRPERDAEQATQRFALSFLVPARVARSELGHSRQSLDPNELLLLKQKYGISMAAWVLRASDVGILRDGDARRHWQAFRERDWRSQEPGTPLSVELPRRMYRLVRRLVAEGVISQARANELLDENIPSVTAIEQISF